MKFLLILALLSSSALAQFTPRPSGGGSQNAFAAAMNQGVGTVDDVTHNILTATTEVDAQTGNFGVGADTISGQTAGIGLGGLFACDNGLSFVTSSGNMSLSSAGVFTVNSLSVPFVSGTASASINFGIVASGFSSTQTVACAGASVGDNVIIGLPSNGGMGIQRAWISTSGTISINSFAAIALTSTAQTYTFIVLKQP